MLSLENFLKISDIFGDFYITWRFATVEKCQNFSKFSKSLWGGALTPNLSDWDRRELRGMMEITLNCKLTRKDRI